MTIGADLNRRKGVAGTAGAGGRWPGVPTSPVPAAGSSILRPPRGARLASPHAAPPVSVRQAAPPSTRGALLTCFEVCRPAALTEDRNSACLENWEGPPSSSEPSEEHFKLKRSLLAPSTISVHINCKVLCKCLMWHGVGHPCVSF